MTYPAGPPMGWNSWNSGMELTERSVMEVIDAMVDSGLRDAGYRYVILDAGWAAPTRDGAGRLRADPERFPNGIAPVVDYAHERHLLFGLYSSPFNETCGQGRGTASAGHELTDADSFASWQVDFLKYDWCRVSASHDDQARTFAAMRDALRASGRRILYSINPNSSSDGAAGRTHDWSGIADMVRTGGDVLPVWRNTVSFVPADSPIEPPEFLGVDDYFDAAVGLSRTVEDHWLDHDMLVVGVSWTDFVTTHFAGLSEGASTDLPQESGSMTITADDVARLATSQPDLNEAEQRSHFSLWAMLAAPLMLGNDVRTMSPEVCAVVTNREIIAINQDAGGAPAQPLNRDPRIWTKPLADGSTAVAVFNLGEQPASFHVTSTEMGMPGSGTYCVRELWSNAEVDASGDWTVGPVGSHDVTLAQVTPLASM